MMFWMIYLPKNSRSILGSTASEKSAALDDLLVQRQEQQEPAIFDGLPRKKNSKRILESTE
jgi:hypothetical protein